MITRADLSWSSLAALRETRSAPSAVSETPLKPSCFRARITAAAGNIGEFAHKRRRKRRIDLLFLFEETARAFQIVSNMLGAVWAYLDAVTAHDAQVRNYGGADIFDFDRLDRTLPDAFEAVLAFSPFGVNGGLSVHLVPIPVL